MIDCTRNEILLERLQSANTGLSRFLLIYAKFAFMNEAFSRDVL